MKKLYLFGIIVLLFNSVEESYSAGFAIKETSARHVGQSFAGMGAITDSVSAIWNNPAVAANFNNHVFESSASCIIPSARFVKNAKHTSSGNNEARTNPFAVVPALYGLYNINSNYKLSIAITAPFGMSTEYDTDSIIKESVVNSSIESIDINPSIAWKYSDKIYLALGISVQKFTVERSRFNADSNEISTLEGKDWGFGYNLGMQFKPYENLVLGISYRSSIDYKLNGKIAALNQLASRGVKAGITAPQSLDCSVSYKLNDRYTLLSSLVWTGWSTFDKLKITSNDKSFDKTEVYNWKNVWFASLGLNYIISSDTLVRFGFAFDQSPVNKITTPSIPDADRYWLSVGVDYYITDNAKFSFNYAHIHIKEFKIEYAIENRDSNKDTLISGNMSGSADVIGLHFCYTF